VPTTPCIPNLTIPSPFKLPTALTFDAPTISSDGGALLLRQIDDRLGLCAQVAALIPDHRDASRVTHSRVEQIRQRAFQIALGYEDCNDANTLRRDSVLKLACDRLPNDPKGLSSQPSLSRMEHAPSARDVVLIQWALERSYVEDLPTDTTQVVLDVDSTDDPTHGQQPLSYFNAHYDIWMYFPVLVFDGEGRLVTARLRPGNAGGHRYTTPMLERVIRLLKGRFPQLQIFVRGDGGFCAPRLMKCLEALDDEFGDIDYALGVPQNKVLLRHPTMVNASKIAEAQFPETRSPTRVFAQFDYAAGTWPHERRIIAKAEHLEKGPNPRFVVTSMREFDPRLIYERVYCARGQAENWIKDFKRALRAERLSCTTYVANAFRLMLHALAYRLMHTLRTALAAHAPGLSTAQFDTIRLRLLKVAAVVTQSVRRIVVALPRSFPLAAAFRGLAATLGAAHGMAA